MGASAVAPAEVEQLGDLGDGFGAGADVAHGAAGIAVPGLGHDRLELDVLLPEVGGGAMPELVKLPTGATPE